MKLETIELLKECVSKLTYCWDDETMNNWDLSCIDTAIKLICQTAAKEEK